jgi:hypothetical protein
MEFRPACIEPRFYPFHCGAPRTMISVDNCPLWFQFELKSIASQAICRQHS